MDLLLSGGIVLLVLVLISLYAVYLFFARYFKISRERMDVDELMEKVNSAVLNRDLDSAIRAAYEHGGPVGRVLHKRSAASVTGGRRSKRPSRKD